MSYQAWDALGEVVKFVGFALLLAGGIVGLFAEQHRKPGVYWEDRFLTLRQIKLYTPKGQRIYRLGYWIGLIGFLLVGCWVMFFVQSWE